MSELYRLLYTQPADLDLHAFATAYVAHVEATGTRPDPRQALGRFRATGKI